MNQELQTFYYLGVALSIGLLIGVERGWKARKADVGERVAGVRTYGLISLLGGGLALLADQLGAFILGLAFIGISGLLTAVYIITLKQGGADDIGITSLIASLLAFVLGALAAMGEVKIAAASAVVTTLLLSYKPLLHHWVSALEENELRAGIKLLLISVVLLPILPNQGYGPWQALNPYEIWWMVVLIAVISFVGYFSIKIGGTSKGAMFTGLFGGLVASTAVTLHFSKLARNNPSMTPALSTGILLACGTMLPRTLLVACLINPDIFQLMLIPAIVMALLIYMPGLWYWRSMSYKKEVSSSSPVKNPLEIKAALGFGVLLTVVMLLGKALKNWFGEAGVLMLAAASGIADVDAINLSLARMSQNDLALNIAVIGIIIAAVVNNLVKGGIATLIGGKAMGLRVGLPLLASAIGGLLSVWLWIR
ncbi:MAG: MgtC/SapB family protein [Gammaproteobacteria bacterium]